MKAVVLPRYGGAEELEVTDTPMPPRGPGEVLIRQRATSVNPVDWKIGSGAAAEVFPAELPLIPGWDAAGVITEVGSDVTDYQVGDEVFGYVRRPVAKWGTYAEYTTAEPWMIARKPASLDWDSAGALPLVGVTALQALDMVGVQEGDTVLVHAASGGVGTMAVQIAKARGARVIGTASARNHDYLRAFGAEPVEYGDGLLERLRRLVPDGPDAALDAAGGDAVAVSIAAGAAPDRVVSIVDPSVKEQGAHHFLMNVTTEDLQTLGGLTEARRLTVPIAETYPLDKAADAWRASQTGRTRGKLVLRIS